MIQPPLITPRINPNHGIYSNRNSISKSRQKDRKAKNNNNGVVNPSSGGEEGGEMTPAFFRVNAVLNETKRFTVAIIYRMLTRGRP